jgi:hypothetical protein
VIGGTYPYSLGIWMVAMFGVGVDFLADVADVQLLDGVLFN